MHAWGVLDVSSYGCPRLRFYLQVHAYYFDSGDSNSVREMGLFCAEIPSKV